MLKFKINVEKIYYKEVVVYADDKDHALEIASELDDFMEVNDTTYAESNYDAVEIDNFEEGDELYEPVQDYLK